jgi:hypothetical protein
MERNREVCRLKKEKWSKSEEGKYLRKEGFEREVEKGALKENRVKRGGRVLKREREEEAGHMGWGGKG